MDIDLQSMSLDELWALHETICLILARKLEAEKRSHEQRLNELRRKIGKASNETPERRPYPKAIRNFEIQNRLIKHGPVVATCHVGSANWLRPGKAWMMFAFTKSLRGEPPFENVFVRRVGERTDGTKTLAVASLVREGPAMNKQSSVATSTAAPKLNIAQSYLELQRLRELVQQEESSHVRHVVDSKQCRSVVNAQRSGSLRPRLR